MKRFHLVLLLLAIESASAFEGRKVLFDRVDFPPTWHLLGRAPASETIRLVVAVRQPSEGLEELERQFWAVSDPSSLQWQDFLQRDEIAQITASAPADFATAMEWIRGSVSTEAVVRSTGDSIDVLCTVREAEKLFETEISAFVHDRGQTIFRAMGPHSVPRGVHEAIDFVEGISDFPMHRSSSKGALEARKDEVSTLSKTTVFPQTLRKIYSVPSGAAPSKVSQGAVEFQDSPAFNKDGLKSFFEAMDLPPQEIESTHIVGHFNGKFPGMESSLDVEYLAAIGQNHTDWYWTSDNWLYSFASTFFNTTMVPDTVSLSYGWSEAQQCALNIKSECKTLGINSNLYVQRLNTEFMKIGLRGVSVVVSSGDNGANGPTNTNCSRPWLEPNFPASSPYVTTVGATMLTNETFDLKSPPPACLAMGKRGYPCASGGTEIAVSTARGGFTSGGGFSNMSAMPQYQTEAVQAYLTSGVALPPTSYYNAKGRAYPDIAAHGFNYIFLCMGGEQDVDVIGGTSASAPTVAGVMGYLNDLSYKLKGKPLGFLNPLLYQMHHEAPEAFTDITVGDNICAGGPCATCKGFEASKGWDPVTGLGTPVTDKMLSFLEKKLRASAGVQVPPVSIVV